MGTSSSEDIEAAKLVLALRSSFPSEAEKTDRELKRRGYLAAELLEMPDTWVECFADRTTEAVAKHDAPTIEAHTRFFAHHYLLGSERIRRLVDVAYAEPLLWNASPEDKAWAWKHIAGPVRQLHEEMWGAPGS